MEDKKKKETIKDTTITKKSVKSKKNTITEAKEINNTDTSNESTLDSDLKAQEDNIEITTKKKKLKLTDDMILNVESTVFGRLVYLNRKSGEKVVWNSDGEIQQVSVEGIRAMKSNQIAFFEKNWVRLISIVDDGYDQYNSEDIYNALMLQKYIEASKLDIEELVFNNYNKIPFYVEKMGESFKTQLAIKCNDMIKNGTLDSYSLIRKLEHILQTELRETN